jgi:MFS family permease
VLLPLPHSINIAIAGTIEQPNYPIMVLPGAHQDSFPDTGGLGFSAATYMVPMSALLGVAIASMFIGMASDKVGRKPCMLLCLYGTVVGCILKYLFRFSFWPYCGFNFLNGLFSASVPVSLAYAGDVNETKREKDSEIGVLVGISMLGAAGGGIIAILMETQGLFVVSVNCMYLICRYASKFSFLMHLLY